MNGARALIYARSRHGNNGEGSDFARSRRQQQVIVALKSSIESVGGIGKLPDVINALGENVLTNLTIGDAESLYGLVKGVNPASIEHISIDDTNFLYDCGYPRHCGSYYLFAHDQSFKSLSHFVQDVFPPLAALADDAQVTFVNASGRSSTASARWASLMHAVGFTTAAGSAAPTQVATQVIDNSGGKDTAAAQWLAMYFGVTVTTEPVPTAVADDSAGHPGSRPRRWHHRRARRRRRAGVPRRSRGRSVARTQACEEWVGMRIAVLTGGGDAPGLNAAIRAIGRRALTSGDTLFGMRNGWTGLRGTATWSSWGAGGFEASSTSAAPCWAARASTR